MNPQVVRVTDISVQHFLALPPSRSARCMLGSMVKGSEGSIHDMSMAILRMLILQTQASPGGNMDANSVAECMDQTASLQRLPSEIS